MNKLVKSAARVLDVLELLSSRTAPVRLNELAQALGIPKSSTYGLLSTLVARGYVLKDSGDRYAIVESFRQGFGWVGGFEGYLTFIATPIVEEIRDQLNETVFVCVRTERQDARLLVKAVSRQPIRYDASDQTSLPGYGTVMGRVLLAHQPDDVINSYFKKTELLPFNEKSVIDEDAIRAELKKIRENGFGTIVDEYAIGGAGIAAPIRNSEGRVVAVIDVATVTMRYDQRRDEMLAAVLEGASRISARLGHQASGEENQKLNSQGGA